MSLIEQAAQRLEQLRKAGVDIPQQPEIPPEVAPKLATPVPSPARAQAAAVPPPACPPEVAPQPASRRVDINMEVLAASGVIRPDAPRSRLADEFRVIKRPLIDNAMGKGPTPLKDGNLIMVTSSLPSEGKTFTAANLAVSIAMEMDNTVMLVDADVARPSLLSRFGLPAAKGLLDVLVDESVSLPQVMLRTNIEKLTILPSGTQHPRATELLVSDAMVRLLEEMSTRYADRIILLEKGQIVDNGTPQEVLTESALRNLYRAEISVAHAPDNAPLIMLDR